MLKNQIKYQASWARLYLLAGFLFNLLFLFSAYILNQWNILFNLLAGVFVMAIGWGMLKYPYMRYSENEIQVFGFFGTIRKHYTFESIQEIVVKDHRLYLQGKKLQLSQWLVDKADYRRMEAYFDPDVAYMDELTD
jgi:hypothetical protein